MITKEFLDDYYKGLQSNGNSLSSVQAGINGPIAHPCNCRGPQPGYPRCPCAMSGVVKRDGRWIQLEVDLGPAL